jgi:hypothetical protein
MASEINPRFPIFGTPTTASVRDNFNIAQIEITELQNRVREIFDGTVSLPPGPPGPIGPAGTIEIGMTMTGAPGSNAAVINIGSATDAILQFTIPRGDPGDWPDDIDGGVF